MDELLTAKQVQELLKVDRTTIYRMLNDGRLTGVKVGSQWRFHAAEVQDLLGGAPTQPAPEIDGIEASAKILPIKCMQSIQDVFAEIAEIGSVTTDHLGTPLTHISNSCDFCNLIQESEAGRRGCLRSWQSLANQATIAPEFTACHAGLQYARAIIAVQGKPIALVISGQFYAQEPDLEEQERRIDTLAHEYGIDARLLKLAARQIRVLDERVVNQITHWLSRVAKTFEQIGIERAGMYARLRQISEMTVFHLEP